MSATVEEEKNPIWKEGDMSIFVWEGIAAASIIQFQYSLDGSMK